MIYNENDIEKIYQGNLQKSKILLSTIEVSEGRFPNINSLSGWVYEQTIRYCLNNELKKLNYYPLFNEQVKLYGRVRIDLNLNDIDIEIKALGIFGLKDMDKYRKYKSIIESNNKKYIYLTRKETHKPYKKITINTFGYDYCFFLDQNGEWERFINKIIELLCLKKDD